MEDKVEIRLVADENRKRNLQKKLLKADGEIKGIKRSQRLCFVMFLLGVADFVAALLFSSGMSVSNFYIVIQTYPVAFVILAVMAIATFVLFIKTMFSMRLSRLDKSITSRESETCEIYGSGLRVRFVTRNTSPYSTRCLLGKYFVEIVIPFYEIAEMNIDNISGKITFVGDFKAAIIDVKTDEVKETNTINEFDLYDYYSPSLKTEIQRRI